MANTVQGEKAPTIVRYYRFRNKLKEKTLGLGGGKGEISSEALAKAAEALEELAEGRGRHGGLLGGKERYGRQAPAACPWTARAPLL